MGWRDGLILRGEGAVLVCPRPLSAIEPPDLFEAQQSTNLSAQAS